MLLGYKMVEGVHFDELYTQTPMTESIRIILALSLYMLKKKGKDEWIAADTFNIGQAFANADLDASLYIE